jgi:anti-anti-sigma factor
MECPAADYKFQENRNMLTVNVQNLGDKVILRCQGRIVRGHETAILCSAVQQQGRNVILDLSEVDALDAAGIGALVSLQAAGIYLRLSNPSEQVRQVLSATGLDSIFEFCKSPSRDDANERPRAGMPDRLSDKFHAPVI